MTARAAALGGNSMGIWGNDVNLVFSNPAALNASMSKQATLNYCNYVGDLNFGYAAYAHHLPKYGTIGGGIQFFDYGKFKGYDEFGQETNNFKANDYSINLNYSRPFEDTSFQIGIALKTLISQYDIYRSYGNAVDFGITYHNKHQFVMTILAKNVGFMWKNYSSNIQTKESLPQTVQLGLSYRVPKAPFRLVGAYDQMLKWNLKYISPLDTTGQSNPFDTEKNTADSTKFQKFGKRFGNGTDNFFRHLTVGTEILLSENFMIRIAYNHRRQKEMILPERRGANGLSVGFGFKVKRFAFGFAFTKMASAGNYTILNVGWQL
ncbi:MAG: hypothetical protein K0S32_3825 [Bacteroidetes bacterium]|jgi:hypothetical protein|nr:hypothetical protein [Bacteroidota bacterium]